MNGLMRQRAVIAAVGVNGGTFAAVLGRTTHRLSERDVLITLQNLTAGGILTRGSDGVYRRDMDKWLQSRRNA